MQIRKHPPSLFWFLALVVAATILADSPASAQILRSLTAPFASRFPVLGRILDYNVPGLANPASPLVFCPYVQAEMKARPVFIFSTEHSFNAPLQDISLDLHKDLGFEDQFILLELMARGQVGSLSARVHYDTYLSTLNSPRGHLSWPPLRTGLDLDLINTRALRFGINADAYWEKPVFSGVLPVVGARSIKWDRPVTGGVQVSFNPPGWGGISFSFDSRARWPLIEKSRMTEFEIAAGFRTPETVLGSTAIRGGWRYTDIDLRNEDNLEVDLKWSGVFGELVYYY